jgi:hypothetical protein
MFPIGLNDALGHTEAAARRRQKCCCDWWLFFPHAVAAADRRMNAVCEHPNGFLPVLPPISRLHVRAHRGKLRRDPFHSHSIVSETPNPFFLRMESFRQPEFTVRSAVKSLRLSTIDADRRRKGRSASAATRHISTVNTVTGEKLRRSRCARQRNSTATGFQTA